MAKNVKKSSTNKKAKKKPLKKKKSPSETGKLESPIPPKKRAMTRRQLAKIGSRPSRPTKAVGPTLDLSFDAPLHPDKQKPKRKPARKKKSR